MTQWATGDGRRATVGAILRISALAVVILVSGCGGSLFDSDMPAPTRYVISPPPPVVAAPASAVSDVDLAIGRPDVAPGLDTERIAVVHGHELDYYRAALWSGSVLETVQTFLVATLQDQHLFRSVAPEQSRITGHYLLDVEVRDFQAESSGSGAPTAHVTLVCRLIRIEDRRLVDVITATASQPSTENRMTAVAAAFEIAMRQVALELNQRTAALVAADKAK